MAKDDDSPKEYWTLEDYAISLFKANRTDSDEFRALLSLFGRPKLADMWERYKAKERGEKALKGDIKS